MDGEIKTPKIYGFNTFSEAGKDNFSPTIFLGGCNLRCSYCMNAKLVLDYKGLNEIDIEEVKKFVLDNKCEFVNISGGEVTRRPSLEIIALLDLIKSWGVKVAVSTNGLLPYALRTIIDKLDYVTMDIKTDQNKYDRLYGYSYSNNQSFELILKSLDILRDEAKKRSFDYEIRTTLYRSLVGEEELKNIGSILNKDETWTLQPFRKTKYMIGKEAYFESLYSEDEMTRMLDLCRQYCDNVDLRLV